LWREIFIDSTNPNGDSDTDSAEEDMLELYKKACAERGVKVNKEALRKADKSRAVNSAKVELANREKDDNIVLPPIKYPSMHPKEKPHGSAQEQLVFERLMRKNEKQERRHR